MSTILDSLPKWFSERPQWLQIAATRLLQQSFKTSMNLQLCASRKSTEGHSKRLTLFLFLPFLKALQAPCVCVQSVISKGSMPWLQKSLLSSADDLRDDMIKLKNWREEYKERSISAVSG